MMRDRLSWAMDELDLKHSERKQWLSHLHFAKLPLSGLSDVGANFVPYLVSTQVSCEQFSVMRGALPVFHCTLQCQMCFCDDGALCAIHTVSDTNMPLTVLT